MNVEKVLTWVSRALFGLGLLLFAGLFVFMAVGSSPRGVDASGEQFHSVSAGEMTRLVLVFSSVAWCWIAGAAARTLATAASWGRALPEIASLVGFALFFAAPTLLVSGASAENGPTHVSAAAVCAISGFAIITVARIVAFVTFGAKDALHSVEQVVDQVQDSIVHARDHAALAPPVQHSGLVEPSVGILTPESMAPGPTSPDSQV